MDRDAFLQLPPTIALRVLFDCLDEETVRAIGNVEKLSPPRPPKYDQMIFRQGGVMYASECDIEGLRFWYKRSTDGGGDPKYADSNKRRADALARFIAWREWYPDAAWTGERDRAHVVARPPSAKPRVYQRQATNGTPKQPNSAPAPREEEDLDF